MNETPLALASPSSAGNGVSAKGTSCCVCGSAEFRLWRRAPDHIMGGWTRYTAVRCVRCGTRRLQPRPDAEAMAHAYSTTTYARAEGEAETAGLGDRLDGFFERQAERAMAAWEKGRGKREEGREGVGEATVPTHSPLSPLPSSLFPGSLLDVGCGDGRFIASMQKRGWQAEGLETDPVAAGLARRRTGAAIYETALDDAQMIPGAFNLVSLLHVIEHVPDPRATLKAAHKALAPGGMLLLALPNAGSIEAKLFGTCWYPLDLPRHYWGFTPRTLVRLVEECGFQVKGLDYFPFLFALQSIRYAVRSIGGRPATPPDPLKNKPEAGGLRTRLFLSLLEASQKWGKTIPGEIMELYAVRAE